MKSNNKPRKPHSYKCPDADYKRAMKRAKKVDKTSLTKLIEEWVTRYGKEGDPVEIYQGDIHDYN